MHLHYQPGTAESDPIWYPEKCTDGSLKYHDHIDGFDATGRNHVLDTVPDHTTVYTEYYLPPLVKQNYPNLEIKFDSQLLIKNNHLRSFPKILEPSPKAIKNFVCCFGYSYHTSREYLLDQLIDKGWYSSQYCTNGFTTQKLHQMHIVPSKNKMDFIGNLTALSPLIADSFLEIVSETVAHTYVPFVTEKFLFPIANKTLWVTYGQPGWHAYVEEHWGFRKYSVFDYSFDTIQNPLERLEALTQSLEPFASMDMDQWHHIYKQEQETIEYNFEWARSHAFINKIKQSHEQFFSKEQTLV